MNIYAISDATGELAISVATAGLRQFKQEGVSILRRGKIRTPDRIAKVVREACENQGCIVFTFVSAELRESLLRMASEAKVPAIDVMGPMMENFTSYFNKNPSTQPGLQYRVDHKYFLRNEAIEFAVKHDDGLGLDTFEQAEIILLGISRTSKTPLSVYMAYRGFKTANVPIILNVDLPRAVRSVERRKLVGLTISSEKLADLRATRMVKLGRPASDNYASLEYIREEQTYANRLFAELGHCPVIDVTSKAIEEVASEVLTVLGI